jgi:ABC-type transport system involved in multi-copper enzyme maturation permease subunit
MARSKSMIVALTDLRNALKVSWMKYFLVGMVLFGPITVVGLLGSMILFIPPTDPAFEATIELMMPTASSMIALLAAIPATLIAANALVGEREQNTLEPLLCTPLTDRELIWGKTLSSLVPCLAILWGGTALSTVGLIVLSVAFQAPIIIFPDLPGLFLIAVGGPIVLVAVVSVMILISGRVSRVYEAYQTGGLAALILMIPMFLPFVFISGDAIDQSVVWLSNILTVLIAVVMAVVTWFLALKRFNRDTMISLV